MKICIIALQPTISKTLTLTLRDHKVLMKKLVRFIQTIIFYMEYYLRNQTNIINLNYDLLWRFMDTTLFMYTLPNWEGSPAWYWTDPNKQHHRHQSIINLNITYSNSQQKPIYFCQNKNYRNKRYSKAQHTQHSQLNIHKSTWLWEVQKSKPLWLWPWEVQRSGT